MKVTNFRVSEEAHTELKMIVAKERSSIQKYFTDLMKSDFKKRNIKFIELNEEK